MQPPYSSCAATAEWGLADMKVRIRYGMAGIYGYHRAGSIVDLPDDYALKLLEKNQADRVEEAAVELIMEDAPAEVETAALEAPEKAVALKGKKKRAK